MDGYSNLTQAIQDGVDIAFEKLDGLRAKCVHKKIGVLENYLLQNTEPKDFRKPRPSDYDYWLPNRYDMVWGQAVYDAWRAVGGWQIWIESEIPIKTRTAAELKPGSVFKGKCPNGETQEFLVAYSADGGTCLIESDIFKALAEYAPNQVEIVEILSGGLLTQWRKK